MDPAITKYTFQLPVDTTRPVSPRCFETCAKEFESGRLSYDKFLDAALAHVMGGDLLVSHPEDCDLANLAKLTTCGPMGAVAAAIKLCMLCDETDFSQEAIDMLHRMHPSSAASSAELLRSTLSADLSPLQLQVVILAALRRGLPNLATDILLSGPEPPKESLFNLLGSEVCPVYLHFRKAQIFEQFPIAFWTAAVGARWVMPSPELARLASDIGPPGSPLLRALLDNPALDIALVADRLPLYKLLLIYVAGKHDDPSLLRDTLARLPPHTKLNPSLLKTVVNQRSQGGVEMLAVLLDYRDGDDHGLDINYRVKRHVSIAELTDVWSGDYWYRESLTALHKAAQMGNGDAVRFLISRGANINEPEYYGKTARDLALRAGHHDIVQLFDQVAEQKPRED
ncbi:hypothetical protein EV127DRAFT_428240 [Xylaria flabelliformis]|nr:hypothetical protein EV127DRAFT_428240 [Xylaria flabelliformis]